MFKKKQVEPSFLSPPQRVAGYSCLVQPEHRTSVHTYCMGGSPGIRCLMPNGLIYLLHWQVLQVIVSMYWQTLNTTFFTSKIRVLLFFWYLSKTSSNKTEKNNFAPCPPQLFLKSLLCLLYSHAQAALLMTISIIVIRPVLTAFQCTA